MPYTIGPGMKARAHSRTSVKPIDTDLSSAATHLGKEQIYYYDRGWSPSEVKEYWRNSDTTVRNKTCHNKWLNINCRYVIHTAYLTKVCNTLWLVIDSKESFSYSSRYLQQMAVISEYGASLWSSQGVPIFLTALQRLTLSIRSTKLSLKTF